MASPQITMRQRTFMDRLGKKLGFKEMKDWYKLSKEDLMRNGGRVMLNKHGSPSQLVRSVFPKHEWKVWKFRRFQMELDEKERVAFIKELGKDLSIRSLEDWYRVSQGQLEEAVPLGVFKKYPLEFLLQQAFPDHNWDVGRLQTRQKGTSRASQRYLVRMLEEIFPNASEFHSLVTFYFRSDGELSARRAATS